MPNQSPNRFIQALNVLRGKPDPRDSVIQELRRDLAGTSHELEGTSKVLRQTIIENASLKNALHMTAELGQQQDRYKPLERAQNLRRIHIIRSGAWMQDEGIPDTRVHLGQSESGFHSGLQTREGLVDWSIVWHAPFPSKEEAITDGLNREGSYRDTQRELLKRGAQTQERSR